ncbi:MAG: ABC transporter ATP-binding protein [Candidatus Omnitrophica bacterium]|nr:ABC transporter ATP-binding protein [Candidatus Omnitrophota bacterium]
MRKSNDYRRLISFVRPHRGMFVSSVFLMLSSSVLDKVASIGLIIPFVSILIAGRRIEMPAEVNLPGFVSSFVQAVFSYLNSLEPLRLLNLLVVSMLVAFLLKGISSFFHSYLMNKLSLRVVTDIKNIIYRKLLRLSLDFYSKSRAGQLVSRITYDAGIVQNAVAEGLRDLIFESVELIVLFFAITSIILVFGIPGYLIFIMLVILPAVAYPVVRLGKKLRSISTSAQKKMGDVNSILYETFSGIRIVKAFDMASYEEEKFRKENEGFFRIMLKSAKRMMAISPISEYVAVVAGMIVIFIGVKLVITGELNPGAFIAFVGCLLQLIKPFKRLSKVHGINQQALAAATRIFELLDKEPTVKDEKNAVRLEGFKDKIVFKDVRFKYDNHEVLKNIDLNVLMGDVIAIVGKSGVGKTTLVNLIPRFYDVTGGCIYIDGHKIKDISLSSLRNQIGIVAQETVLFNDTVKANISYGKINATSEEIEKAARIANADGFIEKLPQKYLTLVGDRGFRLSGGEKQRLAIARAVLKNSPILILDEATSQLDSESERLVQEAFDHLIEGRTVFIIAHRLSTVKHASRIIVLDEGRIAETGTHQELIEKGGLYAKLCNLQFQS